ncbi:helix-turn-helix domain-containing protein [Halococcus thailandensis]|uniref:Bacterio-opsin activator HTH domain-containing protein n=1 Tax=Halococcus thailandensis JCM 13552 TaxID=1227457 RepID=M0N1Z3_9EURY|nr:helix-turn-helix domain-containing protein [Halococcus thailandensis]EMA51513.1 bacterio-opsin activator HTH domain-containing protein [Halococcus thailandensis JCM 13552]
MASETLRYATLTLTGVVRTPMGRRFDRSPAVEIESIRYLGPVEDGQHVGLSELAGDLDTARELLTASDEVLRYDIAGTDGRGIVYGYYRNVGPIGELLDLLYRNDIVLDWPIDYRETANGPRMRFTVIGTETGIQEAADGLPDGIGLAVERIGRFETSTESTLLTDEQAALLALAIDEGYYEVPRETTQRELADRVGVTAGTIGDRLQRIERRVMTAYANDHATAPTGTDRGGSG